MVKRLIPLLVMTGLFGCLPARSGALDLVVPSFDLDKASIVEATDRLEILGLLVCVEIREQDENAPLLALHLKDKNLRQILDAITAQMPGYSWRENFSVTLGPKAKRIVNLIPDSSLNDPGYVLNVKTGPLDLRDAAPADLIRHVQYRVPELLARVKVRGGPASMISPLPPPATTVTINIKTTGVTVREFLNQLAAAAGSQWVCVPERLPNGGFCYEH